MSSLLESPIFHIGFHKTASTYLQRTIFERDPVFLRIDQREIYNHLILPSPLVFKSTAGQKFVSEHVKAAEKEKKVAVFSNERLSGGFHTGGHDSLEILSRIKKCASNARIILCIREQKSMIRSLYAQYVKSFGSVCLEDYCCGDYTHHNKELFNLQCLEYDRLISSYFDAFGAERVTVLPLELLRRDSEQFVTRVYEACGLSVYDRTRPHHLNDGRHNARLNSLQTRLLRLTGPFRVSSIPHIGPTYFFRPLSMMSRGIVWLAGRFPIRALDRALAEREERAVSRVVGDRYCESNKRLEDLIGLDLKSLGYML